MQLKSVAICSSAWKMCLLVSQQLPCNRFETASNQLDPQYPSPRLYTRYTQLQTCLHNELRILGRHMGSMCSFSMSPNTCRDPDLWVTRC